MISATRTHSRELAKRLTILALLSALAYCSMLIFKIPVISFLKYEPKDIFIAFAGFLYGPTSAIIVSAVAALLELPVSSTGLIGCLMNFLSSATFCGTASLIYHHRKSVSGAAIGLVCGMAAMTVTMLLWNYLITPFYMGVSREQVAGMLTTVFLPFNLLKSGINAALALLLYRPFIRVLSLCGIAKDETNAEKKIRWIFLLAGAIFVFCGFVIWWMNR